MDRQPGFGVPLVLAALLLLGVIVSPVHAQSDSSVAVGVAVSMYDAANPNADNPVGVGLIGRLRRGSGLGATVGLDWFKSDVKVDVEGELTPLGRISLRPLMAGPAYTKQYAHFSVTASVVAGYTFNTIRSGSQAAARFTALGISNPTVSVGHCFVYRPDFSLWYELGNHFGLMASVSYMGARPTVTTSTRTGIRRETIDVGAPMLTLGFAYGIF
jgi:hypothetical protein